MRARKREEDREPLPVRLPRVPAERRHPEQRDVRVEGDRERERARARRIGVGELERDEREQRHRSGPAAEPLGVLGKRPRITAGRAPAPRRTRPPSRATATARATRSRRRRSAPGGPARRSRRSTSGRGCGTDPCRRTAPTTQTRKKSATESTCATIAQRAEDERARAAPRRSCPARARASSGLRHSTPSRTNETTRTIGRAPVEHPRRNREVLDPPDSVRDDVGQGRTSRTASSASGWWSSTSNRPGRFAVKGMRTGFPGVTCFSTS